MIHCSIHWGVVNIAGSSGSPTLDVASGHVIAPYMGCAPDAGSGRHRYVFLLYRQSGVIPTDNLPSMGHSSTVAQLLPSNIKQRCNFDHHRFFNEKLGGQPTLVAGNFFFAELPA